MQGPFLLEPTGYSLDEMLRLLWGHADILAYKGSLLRGKHHGYVAAGTAPSLTDSVRGNVQGQLIRQVPELRQLCAATTAAANYPITAFFQMG